MKSPAPVRNADRTRALILDAAERIFERDGWQNATMSAIGAEAGVSRGTPGYFFRSKTGLRAAMCRRLCDAARAAAAGLELAGDPRDQAIALLHGQLVVATARPGLARLAVEHWSGARAHGPADDVPFAALERDLVRRIRELIESVPGRPAGPETGRAAAALLLLVWSAALPNAPGGSATSGSAALSDQREFISALMRKLFEDNVVTHTDDHVATQGDDAGRHPLEVSLTSSKLRNWRLPGVG